MTRFCTVVVCSSILYGQDALDIFRKTEHLYQSLESYQALITSIHETRTGNAPASKSESRVRTSYRAPSLFRSEGVAGGRKVSTLSDASSAYHLMPSGRFVKSPVPGNVVRHVAEPRARNLVSHTTTARVIRDEDLTIDGETVACWVIDRKAGPRSGGTGRINDLESTWWIAKQSGAIIKIFERLEIVTIFSRKQEQTTESIWREIKFNPELPDSLFAPPTGDAIETGDTPSERPSLKGRPAPQFTLTDLNGVSHDLASLKGKTVLLNFWATWCEPCRAEMPFIELLHRSFSNKGLVVLAIGDEEEGVARDYLTSNRYSFPALQDPGGKVSKTYGATVIPTTCLIGPDGTVLLQTLGLAGNADLKEELQKLGIW